MQKMADHSPSFITCQSEHFTTTVVETATAVHLSRPMTPPAQITLKRNSEIKDENGYKNGV